MTNTFHYEMTKTWVDVNAAIVEYVSEYEMICEGEEGESSYYPNSVERYMLSDAIHGLLADREFCNILRDVLITDNEPKDSNRFEQLAADAGLIASEYNGFDRTTLSPAQHRFAELIAKDSIECAMWVGQNNQQPVAPVHTANAIKCRINKWFGLSVAD